MNNLKNFRNELINYLYQYDLMAGQNVVEDEEFQTTYDEIIENIDEIDDIITSNLFNYQLERLSFVDRAIIRLATYELKYTELPSAIIINEAINLTKQYSDLDDEKQHKFNNKLLDNINKDLRG